jgi:GNAT superfamily N-acetyltransferase
MRADPERAHLIESALSAGHCVVAVDDAEIAGFAILNYTFFHQGFVPLLVVGIGSRRIGVGRALLSEVERRCRKSKLYISANRSNLPAQRFEILSRVVYGDLIRRRFSDDPSLALRLRF